jgi:sugar phosphate isomerase/epimerase
MNTITRRGFVRQIAAASVAAGGLWRTLAPGIAAQTAKRKMTICLSPGAIGVSASQREAIDLAARHGFESVEPYGDYLASLSAGELQDLMADVKRKGLGFGAAGLPIDFRQDESRFAEGLRGLPKLAAGLQRAGVTRVGTWLMPCHGRLTYTQNYTQHAARLREAAKVLKDHGLRLGIEYVGTRTVWTSQKFPFIHTLAETRDLIAEIGTGNVGVVLDSWHWWQAGDSEADLRALRNEDIVAVDLNDAPAGVAKEAQIDGRRELPMATGVIDVGTFLITLNELGYDGPVRAEPFNKKLNELDNEAACAATVQAMKKAFALIK